MPAQQTIDSLTSRLTLFLLVCVALACTSCAPTFGETANQHTPAARFGVPIRLQIPVLGIDASILPVGQDRYGAMEAPGAGHPASDPIWAKAFWWKLGIQPGQVGNAVLAGHVDRSDGSPAVFWNLRHIHKGDHILITEQEGQQFTFQITAIEAFPIPHGGPHDPIIQRVFGPATTANLNLITCGGVWIGTEFNKRLVVFSTLIPPS